MSKPKNENLDGRILLVDPPEPTESDEDFCVRLFDGEVYRCRICGKGINWEGICERCKKRLDERKQKSTEERLLDAGVPQSKLNFCWSEVRAPAGINLDRIKQWDGFPNLLTIYGSVGAGKTGVAVCVARSWVVRGRRVKFLFLPKWLDELRWKEGEGSSHLFFQQAVQFPGLLIADELITDRVTDLAKDKLFQLADGREGLNQPTLFTSNLPLVSNTNTCVASVLGPRIASRLRGGMVVEWKGKDMRRSRNDR